MKRHRIVAIVAMLSCAAVGVIAPAAGCGGTGTTPVCTFADGAINAEAGCGIPVEASALSGDSTLDAPEDQAAPPSEDAPTDTNPSSEDASDASDAGGSMDAADGDAHHDSGDAHEDAKDTGPEDAKKG